MAAPRVAAVPVIAALERRLHFVSSFDVTQLTQLRDDPRFADVDGSGVVIAVLDSGIHAANPDLQANVVGFYDAVADPVSTPFTAGSVGAAFDLDGHGTHTAGIAASSNPDIGVAYAAKIVSVKVLAASGEKQLGGSPLVRGLRWVKLNAVPLGIRVVNLSVGTATNVNAIDAALESSEIHRLINELEGLGLTVVASSGNSYAQYASPGATSIAAASTISVASTWATGGRAEDLNTPRGGSGDRYLAIESAAAPDRLAATSQRSTLSNQVAAPGQAVYSTWNGVSGDGGNGFYKNVSGTSMAAPFVSGLVALMQDAAFTFGGAYLSSPARILQIIQETSDRIRDADVTDNNRYDSHTGQLLPLPETDLFYSRVNVQKAIARVVEIVTAGNPAPGEPGVAFDLNAVRGTATVVPQLNGTRSFTYMGSIGRDGVIDSGGGDVDLFRVSLQARGSLVIKLSRPQTADVAFDAVLRLFNVAGTEIGHADGVANAVAYPVLQTDPFEPLNTGTYYIGVSALGNSAYNIVTGTGVVAGVTTGAYRLDFALNNPDPDGVAQGALDVDLTQPTEAISDLGGGRTITVNRQQGIIGSDRPSSGERFAVDADVDMYRVVAPDDGKLHINVEAAGLYGAQAADTYVKVYDVGLNLLAQNDDEAGSTDSRITLDAVRGSVYYVATTVFANRAFDASDPYSSRTPNSTPADKAYDLLLWFDNGDTNGTALSAVDLPVGAAAAGTVGVDAKVVGGGSRSRDVDWYRVTAAAEGLLEFKVDADADFAASLSLWTLDPAGKKISRIDDDTLGIDAAASKLSLRVTPGQQIYAAVTGLANADFNWFAVASGTGGATGGYTLSTDIKQPAAARLLTNNSLDNDTPTVLGLGETVAEAIGRDSDIVMGASDVDLFAFTPASNLNVVIRTIASSEEDADTFLRLFDSGGKQIAFNDNGSTDAKASWLNADLSAGQTYYIGVNGSGPDAAAYNAGTGANAAAGSTGRYRLTVEAVLPGNAAISFSVGRPAAYTTSDGEKVRLKLVGPGTGSLRIEGPGPDGFLLTLNNTTAATRLIVKGVTTFGDVRVSGPLKLFKAPGISLAGTMDVQGSLGGVVIASGVAGSGLLATSLGTARVSGSFDGDLAIASDVAAFRANRISAGKWLVGGNVGLLKLNALSGDLAAGGIRRIAVRGSITDTQVMTSTGGISALSAAVIERSAVRTAGDIGKAIFGSAIDSLIYAGVAAEVATLPIAADAFVAPGIIQKCVIRSGPFSDTVIAASTIRSATLRGVQSNNGNAPFGLAAVTIDALSVQDGPRWEKGQQPTVSTPMEDFNVRLFQPLQAAG